MAGQTTILRGDAQRQLAHRLINAAGENFVVNVRPPSRNTEQNARMWAMLSDVSRAKPEGRKWVPETWKAAFMQSLGHQCQFSDSLDGESGPFAIGFRTSRLTVGEMADLITVISEYGDRHGVEWSEPNPYEDGA